VQIGAALIDMKRAATDQRTATGPQFDTIPGNDHLDGVSPLQHLGINVPHQRPPYTMKNYRWAMLVQRCGSAMRFEELTYEEIRQRAAEGCLAILPVGCTEQQGPHLTVDFDSWFAQQLMEAAAARAREEYGVCALVLPAIPFGPTPEHRNYGAGFIDIPVVVHEQLIEAILASLADQGFKRILLWRGCGGHELRGVVDRFNAAGQASVSLPEHPYHAIWCRLADPAVPGGHADSFATSISLYLRPRAVRRDRILSPDNRPVDWEQPDLDFTSYSSTGVIGDPTKASRELGAQLWEATVEAAANAIREASFEQLP